MVEFKRDATLRLMLGPAHSKHSINVLCYCSYAKAGAITRQTSLTLMWGPIPGSTLCQFGNVAALLTSTVASYDITWKQEVQRLLKELIPGQDHVPPPSGLSGSSTLLKGGHVKPCWLCKWVNPVCLTGLESTCPAYRHRDRVTFSNTAKSNKTPQPNSTCRSN